MLESIFLFLLCCCAAVLRAKWGLGGNETSGSQDKHRPDYNWCGTEKPLNTCQECLSASPAIAVAKMKSSQYLNIYLTSSLRLHPRERETMMKFNENGMRSAGVSGIQISLSSTDQLC